MGEAKNSLESFIIDIRERMGNEAMEQVSLENERQTLRMKFDEMEEWLYEEGISVQASAYHSKQRELTKLTEPIFLRHAELEARPKAVIQAREAINWTVTILETWATERPEITEEDRTRVADMCANFTEWLDSVEDAQATLGQTDPPAFLSTTVTSKLEPIEGEVRKLIRKPKPRPPKMPKTNATSSNSSSSGDSRSVKAEEPNATDSLSSHGRAQRRRQ